MKHYSIIPLLFSLTLTACALPATKTAVSDGGKAEAQSVTPVPYPEPDLQNQFDQLALQVSKLEHQIVQLQTRVRQLEQKQTTVRRRNKAQTVPTSVSGSLKTQTVSDKLNEAQQAYQQGNYQNVLSLLRGADSGGNGSNEARESMYLLLQAHQRLENCQSVINIGQRYAAQYANQSQADEALYIVGQCQWQIQQRDIARDTWQKLIRQYPDGAAAKRAAARLKP